MIFDVGINDMEKGWTTKNELNNRIYILWYSMIRRCYSEQYLKNHPTYRNVKVCERWLKLSNFIEDVTKIENFHLWEKNKKYSLDKDIKQNHTVDKVYNLENCIFVSCSENIREMISRNNPNPPKKIIGISISSNNIVYFKSSREAEKYGFNHSSINSSCYYHKYGKLNNRKIKYHKGFKWFYLDDISDEVLIKLFIQEYLKLKGK